MVVTKQQIIDWLDRVADVMAENKELLIDLDAAIGDGDHGSNMNRGFAKVREQLPKLAQGDIGTILKTTGMTLMSSVGGASGPLYGTFFMRAGMALAAKEELDSNDLLTLLQAGCEGIVQRGKPNLGDKTMYDVWQPVVTCFQQVSAEKDLDSALSASVSEAKTALEATIPMQAKKGRASYLGERSIGHQDPGATSSYFILNALYEITKG